MSKPGKASVFDGNGQKFSNWKAEIQAHLNREDILYALLEDRPDGQAAAAQAAGRAWDRARTKVHSELMLYTTGAARAVIKQYSRAIGDEPAMDGRAAWAALEAKYEEAGVLALVQADQELGRLRLQPRQDPEPFFERMDTLLERLGQFEGEDVNNMLTAKLIARLPPDEYDNLIPLARGGQLTYEQAKNHVRSIYQHRQGKVRDEVEMQALFSERRQSGGGGGYGDRNGDRGDGDRGKGRSGKQKKKPECWKCGSLEHFKQDCPLKRKKEDKADGERIHQAHNVMKVENVIIEDDYLM